MSTYRIGLLARDKYQGPWPTSKREARLEGLPKEGRQEDSYPGERPYLPSGINVGGNVTEIQNGILNSY